MGKKFISILFVAILIAVGIMGFKDHKAQVVCFGDSITYGAKVDGHSWVWFLSQDHSRIDFINAGRSGRKTSDRQELLPVLQEHPAAGYYLIFLGVNDLKDGTDSMINNCVTNMQWMIAEIRRVNSKADIVILAPCDISLKTMNDINVNKKYNENTEQSLYKLETKYKQLAKEEQTGFISLLHVVSQSNYTDGVHPDVAGQKQMAKAVWKGLKKIID